MTRPSRDWLRVASNSSSEPQRMLLTTPHAIAVMVAHQRIAYGDVIEQAHHGHVLRCVKQAVFQAVRDVVTEYSTDRTT